MKKELKVFGNCQVTGIRMQKTLPSPNLKKTKPLQLTKNPKNLIFFISSPLRSLPNFFIIGAAKCGTTSLYNYLIQHPHVIRTHKKELYFFDRYYSYGLNFYRSNFPIIFHKKNFKKLSIGEATPTYIHHPLAALRLKKYFPKAKIIILLRNPVERAYSHYQMELKLGYENLSFEKALEEEQKRIEGEDEKMEKNPFYYSYKRQVFSYVTNGIYVNQLERWLEIFPKDQLLILSTEEFKKNTLKIFSHVLEFLNLSKITLDFNQYQKGEYSNMKSETRKNLVEFFKPYNEKLYLLLNKNFDWS